MDYQRRLSDFAVELPDLDSLMQLQLEWAGLKVMGRTALDTEVDRLRFDAKLRNMMAGWGIRIRCTILNASVSIDWSATWVHLQCRHGLRQLSFDAPPFSLLYLQLGPPRGYCIFVVYLPWCCADRDNES